MPHFIQPRGRGGSWVFRMVTPPELIGVPNVSDGKPLKKEIKKGLGTRHFTVANLDAATKPPTAFLEDDAKTSCMEDLPPSSPGSSMKSV